MEANLVKRLEVAVSRLEAISSQKPNLAPKPTSNGASVAPGTNEIPEAVRIYDEHIEEPLKNFLSHCTAIGQDLAEAASKIRIVFDLHRNFLWSASGQAEPSDTTALQSKLSPIASQVQNFSSFKDSKKTSPHFQHLAAIAEGIPAVFWVTVKKTPAPYVKEMSDASMFYINRVRKDNKANQVHLDWANSLIEIFNVLQKYIRQVHTTGLVWNSAPGAAPIDGSHGGGVSSTIATPGKAASGPPAPPPPPPPGLFAEAKPSDGSGKNVREALFAEINKGDAITQGLKKVTADMQTHKNPALRGQNAPVVGSKPSVTPKPGGAKAAPATDKPPKTELKDNKVWNVEYHKNNEGIVVETDKKQAAYIYKCENSVVQIKGKVNSVTIDSCKKTSVVFENLLAQIEVINCQSIKVQTLGTLPTISIQKTDGCQVYLSKDSLNAELVTSKSSEMNVLAPIGDDGDFVEFPIPEQFKTTLCAKTKKLTTVVSDIV